VNLLSGNKPHRTPDLHLGVEDSHTLDLDHVPARALEELRLAVDAWGGDFRLIEPHEQEDGVDSDARLVLPVQAGLRHGALLVDVTARGLGTGQRTRLELVVARSDYQMPKASLMILGLGLGGALLIVVLPLLPHLVGFLPLGFALMILAWFLVLARVQYRGIREFLSAFEGHQEAK
jgi:hypothetical protein